MTVPTRLMPLLAQFDFARKRLVDRMAGPVVDSGNGVPIAAAPMTDEEYLWEPVPDCWSIRPRSSGPGPRATGLAGGGEWGRDGAATPPSPPPFTTIAWRLGHLGDMLALRAEYTIGGRILTLDDRRIAPDADGGIAAFESGASAWRKALLSVDDAALDTVGYCAYPYGSDREEAFLEIVWWVNQELLHHGAEIALLRDLYRARHA